MERRQGEVKWFNNSKGFGFIGLGLGLDDVFVHYKGIRPGANQYRTLDQGDLVEFQIVAGLKGPQADDVVVVAKAGAGAHA